MLIQLFVVVVVVGLLLYLVKQLPVDQWVKTVATVVLILLVILWLVDALGMMPLGSFGRLR